MNIHKFLMMSIGVVCLVGAYFLYIQSQNASVSQKVAVVEEMGEPSVTIVRTDAGYEPKEVTIKKGDIILFKNESKEFHWPASDLHPTHGIYPEFDPLRPLAQGEDWKFKFDAVGAWKFHDHIRANKVGTVTVTN
jgi:plastocyanin